ncbi:MAG: CDP-alcohol phosphatidyltransferase family protein [Halioglobus sp.]
MLRYLPNGLTLLRLVLAMPLGIFILRENYTWALATGVAAGLSDALDGFAARRLGVLSRFGAALDPIADKILITVSFVCLALVDLVPWYLAAAVIIRDVVIVAGAACYHALIGPFEFTPSNLSKSNLFIQISYIVLILLSQLVAEIPPLASVIGEIAVLFITAASGFDYIMSWTIKALDSRKSTK